MIRVKGAQMSDCIHCEIHDLLESHLESEDANIADAGLGASGRGI